MSTEAWPNTVRDRNVIYVYPTATGEHEQVTALMNVGSTGAFASYSYDEQGNVTSREVAGEGTYYLVHDGNDRLRRLTYPSGESELYYYDHEGRRQLALKRSVIGKVPGRSGRLDLLRSGGGRSPRRWHVVSAPVAARSR